MPDIGNAKLRRVRRRFPHPTDDHCNERRTDRKAASGHRPVRERFHNLHEFVAVARAKLDRNVWDYLIGGAETETTRAAQPAGARLAGLPSARAAQRQRHRHQLRRSSAARSRCRWRSRRSAASSGSIRPARPPSPMPPAPSAARCSRVRWPSPTSRRPARSCRTALKIFQLYVRGDQAWVEAIFDRAVKAGFGALCLTVDTHHYSRRERDISKRYHAASARDAGRLALIRRRSTGRSSTRSRRSTSCRSIIKGIATAEDAKLAVEHGVDVIYVSNHGGRQLDHGARHHRHAAGDRRGGEGQGRDHRRRQLLPRHRRG